MPKKFNVTGLCLPNQHYMADISEKLHTIISDYIQTGKYFTINRARQYGKTTTLYLLEQMLKNDYRVIRLSFEAADEMFVSRNTLAQGLIRKISRILKLQNTPPALIQSWNQPISAQFPIDDLGERITELCCDSDKKIVLMIDEVDKSSDNQVFLSFLGLLRNKYLEMMQENDRTFHSVILAGVYDIKNLKLKLHPEEIPKYNSPWNIASDFTVDMSLSPNEIANMLLDYEKDYHTGMDISAISRLIYDYTSGYPYLVSRICQLTDERLAGSADFPSRPDACSLTGITGAEKLLRKESGPLFDDINKKLADYPDLKHILQNILFHGKRYPFEKDVPLIQLGMTLGFLKEKEGFLAIENRIFETKLYDLFLAESAASYDKIYQIGSMERNQYFVNGTLQMRLVMEKFYRHFTKIYRDNDQKFIEDQGRKIFLLYLQPIINGAGNYYIESQTRDLKRTDIIVDYKGVQSVIELKIWHGKEYNQRGIRQLFEYLDYYKTDTGYLLSFNFNKNKKTGIQEISYHGKRIMEVVV